MERAVQLRGMSPQLVVKIKRLVPDRRCLKRADFPALPRGVREWQEST
jgi:hypothetical protein